MFILEHSEGNVLSTDNECRAFTTYEKARAVMEDQLVKYVNEGGYTITRTIEFAPGMYNLYGNWAGEGGSTTYIGLLNDWDAYLEDGEHRWVIHEIPGAFIPEHNAKCLKQSIHEMHEIYCDEDRENWFDADDMAKDIAYELEEYFG